MCVPGGSPAHWVFPLHSDPLPVVVVVRRDMSLCCRALSCIVIMRRGRGRLSWPWSWSCVVAVVMHCGCVVSLGIIIVVVCVAVVVCRSRRVQHAACGGVRVREKLNFAVQQTVDVSRDLAFAKAALQMIVDC